MLANPQKITAADLTELNVLVSKYPYFQSARALQLKGLRNNDSFLSNDALKLTAAHTTDRDILFEYITSEKFIQNEISQSILQHDSSVDEIKVISEDISEQISLEIDRQLKAEIQKAETILNPDLFQRKQQSVSNSIEKETENAAEVLQPDQPLEFTKNDKHSFAEWLKLTKAKPIERQGEASKLPSETSVQEEKERKFELIDRFIQERPKIIPSETAQKTDQHNLAQPYIQASDALMTETLAKVYLQQKNYKKAIQAYKILILKNPEKSGFFADQIRAIEKLINTEEQ